jgi:signal transduction histidine kinase
VAALSRQAAALRARHRLQVHTDLCEEPPLSFEAKEAFYRIAQEALHNVAKHAKASRVDIQLCRRQGEIVLELADDGVGFDPQGEYSGHMGLNSMRERAAQIGGTLEVQSQAGQGSVVRLRIPTPQ